MRVFDIYLNDKRFIEYSKKLLKAIGFKLFHRVFRYFYDVRIIMVYSAFYLILIKIIDGLSNKVSLILSYAWSKLLEE